jgi:hypothetical protein
MHRVLRRDIFTGDQRTWRESEGPAGMLPEVQRGYGEGPQEVSHESWEDPSSLK